MTIFSGFKRKGDTHGSSHDSKASAPNIDARTRAENKAEQVAEKTPHSAKKHAEVGGPKGLEPTRYGDWEKAGRCIDF